MYSVNYPEKLDYVNFGPKITLNGPKTLKNYRKFQKLMQYEISFQGWRFIFYPFLIFKIFKWPNIAWQFFLILAGL